MHAHRQDMVNVELTVDEVRTIIEQAIVNKYSVLDNTWELHDAHFHDKNLNAAHADSGKFTGVTFFFTKDIEIDTPVMVVTVDAESACAVNKS